MRFRLDADHYINEYGALVPAGAEVGDDTQYPCRNEKGDFTLVPGSGMTPLDDEAKSAWSSMSKDKNWGVSPEDKLEITSLINRSPRTDNQPIIPAPIEHVLRPTTMRPGETGQTTPGVLANLAAEAAAKNDEEMARRANESTQKPIPLAGRPTTLEGGQNPAPGIKTGAPSTQVPRDSDRVSPANPVSLNLSGGFTDLNKPATPGSKK